jgi:hypothetical protein
MRKPFLIMATVVLGVAGTGLFAGVSHAQTPQVATTAAADLAMSGSVAGGETSTESSHLIAMVFTLTNKGPGDIDSSADTTVTVLSGGTMVDEMCVLPNGFGINADTPVCEQGQLPAGHSFKSTVILQPSGNDVTLSVRACASNESGIPDPRPGNNCKTLMVNIV